MRRKLQLIEDWNHAWKWASVRCMSAALTIQVAYEAMPETLRANLPHGMVTHASITLLVLGIIGRLVKKDVEPDKPVQVVSTRGRSRVVKSSRISGDGLAGGQSHAKNRKKSKR